MSSRNTLVRSLHDLGAAAWFGGNLMGAVGLNGASEVIADPTDRLKTSSAGWAKWAPVNIVAIGAHLVGGLGLLLANKDRAAAQKGVTANTVIKLVVTAAALGTTLYNGILGGKIAKGSTGAPAQSAVTPSTGTPSDIAAAQKQQKLLQWVTPALVGTIIVLTSQQGEQQRGDQVLKGLAGKS